MFRCFSALRLFTFSLLWLTCGLFSAPQAASQPWLLIDGASATLFVVRDEQTLARFDNISWGRGGLGHKQRSGDGVTPIGEFRIAWINPKSDFHWFFGFDYPNLDYAERAWAQGALDWHEYQRIVSAIAAGRTPPQNTALGGQVGIHGVGKGDPWVHENLNWTKGCVALSNRQIERLLPWIHKGMRVVIQAE